MHYTIEKYSEIDAKIEKDQVLINSKVLGLLGDHVHSIILCGGFGRGEGSVYVKNGFVQVVNDYDIHILLKARNPIQYTMLYKRYHASLQNLAHMLATDLKMKQIDLTLRHCSYFERPKILKIENYEVKQGHVLTYGVHDPTRLMPKWRAEDIPLFEGTWLFRNRGAGMLIPALYFMRDGGIPDEKKENFVIECGKAQLAMGDCILLLRKKYHYLYSQRLRCIDDLDVSDIPAAVAILEHYREALKQKLRPDFEKFYKRDLVEWWFEIVALLDWFYRFFEQKRLGGEFGDWIKYSKLSKPENRFEIRPLISSLLRSLSTLSPTAIKKSFQKARKSYTINIVPLLLFSIKKDGFDLQYMEKASQELGISLKKTQMEDNWIDLVKNFLNDLHPGGEVDNAINI